MASQNLEDTVERVKTLTRREWERLRDLLDAWLATVPPDPAEVESEQDAIPTEDELDQEMLRDGILEHVPPPIKDFSPWEGEMPIEIEGEPLSETIIRERR